MDSREKSRYVQKQITETLIRLLKENEIDEITIRSLCDEAGVGRASFYRSFTSKEDVIRKHADSLLREWGAVFERDPSSSRENVFESLFRHYRDHAEFYTLLVERDLSGIILDAIKEKIGTEQENTAAYRKSFLAYGIYGWVCEWIRRGMQEPPETFSLLSLSGTE